MTDLDALVERIARADAKLAGRNPDQFIEWEAGGKPTGKRAWSMFETDVRRHFAALTPADLAVLVENLDAEGRLDFNIKRQKLILRRANWIEIAPDWIEDPEAYEQNPNRRSKGGERKAAILWMGRQIENIDRRELLDIIYYLVHDDSSAGRAKGRTREVKE